mmetsp:Transcript_27311/g.40456  ORF Transcript_27311/g.40456 Transcript_27311/m.40456 type:complete len:309 (+) Transcript_27311:33-959(+)
MYLIKSAAIITLLLPQASSFVQNTNGQKKLFLNGKDKIQPSFHLNAKKPKKAIPSSRGFGKPTSEAGNTSNRMEKTYDFPVTPIDDKAAMQDFFSVYTDWHPLFASIASHDDVPASSHIDLTSESTIVFGDGTPWSKLPQVPSGAKKDDQMQVISHVLDNFQTALTDIPVSEELFSKDPEDNNDTQFLEEGRRLLVLDRFQVISGVGANNHDIFSTCWSEIHHLVSEGDEDTGSLIILEEFDHEEMDLNLFVDTNIRMPLHFLGLGDKVEVSSFERGKNCIRLIHQLGAIRTLEQRDADVDALVEGFE